MFTEEKKQSIKSKIGIPDELIARIEQANTASAEAAEEAGMKSKEVTEDTTVSAEVETTAVSTTETTEVQAEASPSETTEEVHEVDPADVPPSRQEVAEAVASVVSEALSEMEGRFTETLKSLASGMETLTKEIAILKAKDDDRLEKTLSETPNASLAAMIAKSVSAIGSKEAQITGDDPLLKRKPDEAEPEISPNGKTGIRLIDQFIR